MSKPRFLISPVGILLVGILAVSSSSIMIRYAQEHAGSIAIAAGRMSVASAILIPIALLRNRVELRGLGARGWGMTLLAGTFLAIHFASWITSLAYTNITSSIVIVSTLPLWVALLSPRLLGETLENTVVAGLLIALLGTALMALLNSCSLATGNLACPPLYQLLGTRSFLGDALALLGALSGAGYIVLGRDVRRDLSILPYTAIVYGASAILLLALTTLFKQTLFGLSSQAYLWMVLLAIIPQIMGHSSFNYALGFLPAAKVSIAILGEPIGTILLAYLILGEQPGAGRLVGAILILIGIYIASNQREKTI